jgi:CRP/FNR family transcriptional regulator
MASSDKKEEKLWHLQHCPLLAGMTQAEMMDMEQATVMVKLQPQERLLISRGEVPAVWLVKEGLMSLTYSDADGTDATVLLLEPGDLFGAPEAVESSYGETATALKPTVLCRMAQRQLESLCARHQELAYRVTKFSWRRLARLQQRMAELMTRSVKERLAMLLVRLAAEYGQEGVRGVRTLGLSLTHDDLAHLVGSSREMVSKVMGQFREFGWVHSSRKTIELTNLPALEKTAAHS